MERSEVSFDSDGARCAATLYRAGGAADRAPCVVMAHGFALTRGDGLPEYARRFAAAGVHVLTFDYRHWGGSEGEPRRWFSVRRQLEDWRAAVACARALDGVDPERVAVWGLSMAGAHVLTTAAADSRVAAVIALVPLTDGLAGMRMPVPLGTTVRLTGRALREAVLRRPVPAPAVGRPGQLAMFCQPEAEPGYERIAGPGWRNEANTSWLLRLAGYRPVRSADRIAAPVLLQLAERDAMVPLGPIEETARRAPRAELLRYPIDHLECFAPEHLDRVAGDEVDFLRRHLLAAGTPG